MHFRTCNTLGTDMSIASAVTSLERANAVYRAAQAAATPMARRGMFTLIEREHRYSYLCGAYAGHVSYTPAIVSNVTRDGIAKEVRLVGQSWPLKQRDWRRITVDSAGKIADPESVARQLVDENGRAIEYRDHAEALAAIKSAAGIG
jgi:hypothetical protein